MLFRLIKDLFGRDIGTRLRHQRALWHYESAERARMASKLDDVERQYRSAIALDPEAVALIYNLGLLLQQVGDHTGAEEFFKRALELQPGYQAAQSSLLCVGDFSTDLSREEVYRRHLDWAERFSDPLFVEQKKYGIARDGGRINLGYVSADFRFHVTGRFVEPVLRHHEKSRFKVFCYNNSDSAADAMTEHLKRLSEEWRDVADLSDEKLAMLIGHDKIDILVDLSGHSLGNRLLSFARGPAPVQITWLGYLNTTGMRAMGYRLTDAVSDPPGAERWYREELIRLPQPQWCYVPEAGPVRASVSLPTKRSVDSPLTYGCVTRFMKVNHDVASLWGQVLKSVPGSRLRIIDVPDHARGTILMHHFRDMGLTGSVEFFPTLYAEEYWKYLDEIDIALDTFPYTGATTTCDCLWMGVPVVTLAGVCGAARSASSILSSVGLPALIADSPEEYVEIATSLGTDRARLSSLRAELRRRMLASPICDPILFTRNLEREFERVWDVYRKAQRPHV